MKNNQSSVSNSIDTQEEQSKSHLYQASSQHEQEPMSDRLDLSADVVDESRDVSPPGEKPRGVKGESKVASMLI